MNLGAIPPLDARASRSPCWLRVVAHGDSRPWMPAKSSAWRASSRQGFSSAGPSTGSATPEPTGVPIRPHRAAGVEPEGPRHSPLDPSSRARADRGMGPGRGRSRTETSTASTTSPRGRPNRRAGESM